MNPQIVQRAPHLLGQSVPKEEMQAVHSVENLLSYLEGYCNDFASALVLFDNAFALAKANPDKSELLFRWKFVAARDAGMTIYHFGKVLEAVRSSLNLSPFLMKATNSDQLRAASKTFLAAFPLYAKMRHAIAHAGDLAKPAAKKKHSLSGKIEMPGIKIGYGENITISNNINGREFGTTFENEYISFSMSQESLGQLVAVTEKTFGSFQAAW